MNKYKVYTTHWIEAEDVSELTDKIQEVESMLETTEQSTYDLVEK